MWCRRLAEGLNGDSRGSKWLSIWLLVADWVLHKLLMMSWDFHTAQPPVGSWWEENAIFGVTGSEVRVEGLGWRLQKGHGQHTEILSKTIMENLEGEYLNRHQHAVSCLQRQISDGTRRGHTHTSAKLPQQRWGNLSQRQRKGFVLPSVN